MYINDIGLCLNEWFQSILIRTFQWFRFPLLCLAVVPQNQSKVVDQLSLPFVIYLGVSVE
jgi:hypothetical protein